MIKLHCHSERSLSDPRGRTESKNLSSMSRDSATPQIFASLRIAEFKLSGAEVLRMTCCFSVLILLALLGCTTPAPTTVNTYPGSSWLHPLPGASYTYSDRKIDTDGHTVTSQTAITTLLYSSLDSFNGKTNVERFLDSGRNIFHYIAIEPNGEIARGDTGNQYQWDTIGSSRIIWKDYPISRVPPLTAIIDSGNDGASDVRGNFVITRSFLGMETLHLAGEEWLTYKVRDSAFLFTSTWPNWKRYDTIVYSQTWWYAPRIGNYVKMREHMFEQDQGYFRTNIFERVLTRYQP